MTGEGILALLLHAVAMGAMALLLAGVLPWTRARLSGRAGPPVSQPWHDWRRLLRKRPMVAEGSTALQAASPAVCLVATALAALLVPSFTLGMASAGSSDLLVIVGLLALARGAMLLAAVDTGAAPPGLAALQGARLGALAAPAVLLVVFTVALLAGTTNLDAALAALHEGTVPGMPLLLAVAGWACVVVVVEAEGDGAVVHASGWHAAGFQAAWAMRRVVWLSLLAATILPGSLALAGGGALAWLVGLLGWIAKLAVLGACIVAVPALPWPGTMRPVPLLGAAVLLGLLAVLLLLAGQGLT